MYQMKYRTLTRDCHCQKITVEDSQVLECDFIRSPKFDLQTQLGHVTADDRIPGVEPCPKRPDSTPRIRGHMLGILFSLIVSMGLMALIFYSSRYGYDEPPKILSNDDDQTSG